jgi:HSP20 family protein
VGRGDWRYIHPGKRLKNFTISLFELSLTIKHRRKNHGRNATEKEGGVYLRREVKRSSFLRSFTADSKIFDLDSVKASFEDGVLELQIPKREPEKPKKRTVSIG